METSPQPDDQINSNAKADGVDNRNAITEESAICKNNFEITEHKLNTHVIFNTQPMTEKVKFDWKIKNFEAICPPDGRGFVTCCSNVFTVGTKVGKSSRWCFELRYDEGHLSMVLCRDKIYITKTKSSAPTIPCRIELLSPDGSVALEGVTSENPTQNHTDILARVQTVAGKVGGFVHPRENSEWKRFISINEFHTNRSRYMREDGTVQFKMAFELTGVVSIKSPEESALERCEAHKKAIQEEHGKEIIQDLEALMTNGECTNFVIRCDSKVFSVHKQLLHARCPKFYDYLQDLVNASRVRVCKSSDPLLSKIATLNDVESESLGALLEYIYTGSVKQIPGVFSKWRSLLMVAVRWEVVKLKELCFYKMLGMIDAELAGSFICLADLHEASEDIWEFIQAFCKINYNTLINNESFNKCRRVNPKLFQFFEALEQ